MGKMGNVRTHNFAQCNAHAFACVERKVRFGMSMMAKN